MRRALGLLLTLTALCGLTPSVAAQAGDFRVLQVSPTGDLAQRQDANEIRIVFSEPMVALGRIPVDPTPTWIHITPAIPGRFRWSGTTVLLFTADPNTPIPNATRFTIDIDASATSNAGRQLGTPFRATFTTPTVRLTSMRWYRQANRFDRPVLLFLEFNQPVRPADIASHSVVRYAPHPFDAPEYSAAERARLAADPTALGRFNAKVAAASAAAARTGAVGVRVTTTWDEERFPRKDTMAVLETTTVPPPGTWLELTLDNQVVGTEGTASPAQPQTSTAELDPVFFARGFACRAACNPSGYNALEFTMGVSVSKFSAALSVSDITDGRTQAIARTTTVPDTALDESWSPGLDDAGYDRQPPARTFVYRLPPTLEATDGQTLGYPWVGVVETWHQTAFTSFGDGHGVWELGGGPQLPFYSRNFTSVTQWLSKLTVADLIPRIVALEQDRFRQVPPGAGTVRRLTVTPDATQSYGVDLTTLLSNGPGLVWAGLRPGTPIPRADRAIAEENADRSTIIQVTNLGITVKDSPQSTLVFVTRLDNGAPVTNATVSIFSTANQQLWRGTTDADGVALAPALPLRTPDDWYQLSFIVTAEKDGDVAYVASDWNEGLMPWAFGNNYDLWQATNILRGSIFTDRGVYRPGEEAHFKAIVRTDTPTGIRLLPAGSRLAVRVRDGRNREVDRREVTVNRWSSVEWAWTVPAGSALGNYSIEVAIPGATQEPQDGTTFRRPQGEWLKRVDGAFLVAAYRRPDFRVDATLSAERPVAGSALTGRVNARYLFGGAMAKRQVRWSVTREMMLEVPSAILERFPEDRYVFGYYPNRYVGSERVAGADAVLDPDGTLTVDTTSTGDVDVPYHYTLEGDVEDVSRQHIANRASVVVHPAPWYIGIRRPAYFADIATGTNVDIIVSDLEGRPVSDIPVTLSLVRVQWNSVRRAEGGGFYTWDTEEVRVPAGEWTVTSAATPVPLSIPLPDGGYYVLSATSRDAEGHVAKTESSFYGLGRGYTAWERFDHNRITLEPEKKTWKPGETARLMIQSPWESATALLTIEREGIRRHQRFALTSTQQTVEVPVSEDDIPNVFVSVLLIRGRSSNDPGADGSDPGKPDFRLGYAELKVEDAAKQLTVDLKADRSEYRPANTARVSVGVRDAAGQPAAGEVTLWAVDHGVLALTGYRAPDVRAAVYQDKALQVITSDNRQRIISRRVLTPKGDGEGGGGGAESGASDTRRDFRTLAFWLGSVETDATGQATRDITLPESLTTYRIMAVAGDAASRFGSASAEIRVTKPVTLLSAFPRFLSLGDRAAFGATVTNTMAAGGAATITIRSLDPALLTFEGQTSSVIQLAGGATEPVRFNATARGAGAARVRVAVTLGEETDAFETSIPITVPSPLETTAASGETEGTAREQIALPARVAPGIGGLSVGLASTALVGLGESARYLSASPYTSAEHKASTALALLLAADLGQAFGAGLAPEDARARATSLLRDLDRMQCASGAFPYWPGGCSAPNSYLTSYVLHVKRAASRLGAPYDEAVVAAALDFLDGELKKDTPPAQVQFIPAWSASQAFAVKVLADYGRNQDSNVTRLLANVDRLPVFALSYLADALASANTRDARYTDLIRRLQNAARVEGDRAHVEEVDPAALEWVWSTNVRSTALVAEGFIRRGDDALLVPGMTRWLLSVRTKGRWGNTQENATALAALVAYYRAFEATPPDMTATLRLGARPIGTATFRGRSTTAETVTLAMPDLARQMPAGSTRDLELSRAGTGRLFYTARLQYAPLDAPPATDQGIHVERRYERFVENSASPAATSFAAGDLIRVTLTIVVPQERRFVAVTDPLPAGVEPIDSFFQSTAADLARDASVESGPETNRWWFDRSGFDYVEKHDDRVTLFATRLSEGRHEFSFLVRATTSGTFVAPGTSVEEMYSPEVSGRAAPATVDVK